MLPALLSLILLSVSCAAQDLAVPGSWRKFSNSRGKDELISISQNGINQITPQFNEATATFNGIGYWQSGNVIASLANQDKYSGKTTNKALVVKALDIAFKKYPNYDEYGFNDDALWWATAAFYAYRAYGDTVLLNHAIATWEHVSNFAITSAGKVQGKNFAVPATCNGKTMAGGVFWRPTADDTAVNSITTGLYMTLSAYLASVSNSAAHKNAAIASANWIKNQNLNSNNIALDTINGKDCSRPNNWIFTYNSGKYIEGLAVLADVTGDASWRSHMITVLNAAVKNTAWQGADGIITEGVSRDSNNDGVGFKSILIRGINEAYIRATGNNFNQPLRALIHSYVCVQYNALLDLAATGNTYSSAWHGPPQGFTTWGQMAALDVTVSAIQSA